VAQRKAVDLQKASASATHQAATAATIYDKNSVKMCVNFIFLVGRW
jgi:hypothetical protein